MNNCPLCFSEESFAVSSSMSMAYRGCPKCKLIFAETHCLPSKGDEKNRYLSHQNGIQFQGYVNFLNQAIEPALPLLNTKMTGLDFGCGPTPTLSILMEQQGYSCDNYDPFFFPELAKKEYDFIFATECFEHFFFPAQEIKKINHLLKPGGLLIIMTETYKTLESFASWYYIKDPTHVSLFHEETFEYMAVKFEFELLKSDNERVFILKKP
jgi:SAM-dependent methyltransferase